MNKVLVGLFVGAVLGAIDGATAWFTPAVRDQILSIVFFSTIKGVIAGVAAGWYARRVHSVPKGIVFGFTVGLLLAFAVAAIPQPDGSHFWWQIMVPGSILGGVIGWATQHYGRASSSARSATAVALLAFALLGVHAKALDHDMPAMESNPTFDKLKTLAGTWDANMLEPDGEKTSVVYRVSAAGTLVQETMFPGTSMEMINMYTVDGDAVVATHFCAGDNQPVLRLNAQKSSDKQLVFDFVSVHGKNTGSYINGVTMTFGSDGKVVEQWSTSADGRHMLLYLNSKR